MLLPGLLLTRSHRSLADWLLGIVTLSRMVMNATTITANPSAASIR